MRDASLVLPLAFRVSVSSFFLFFFSIFLLFYFFAFSLFLNRVFLKFILRLVASAWQKTSLAEEKHHRRLDLHPDRRRRPQNLLLAAATVATFCALIGLLADRRVTGFGGGRSTAGGAAWCGGLTEASKVAAMADTWHLPVAPHDCTGPVTLAVGTHLSLSAPNALIQECVRAYYRTWYADLVTQLPPITDGTITIPPGPGLGLELSPDIDKRLATVRVVSDAKSL